MLQQNEDTFAYLDNFDRSPPQPFDPDRWETIRNRLVDELAKDNAKTLETFADAASIEVDRLKIWLKSPDSFPRFGRRVGDKTQAEQVAEALELCFSRLDGAGIDTRMRCPVRVETSVLRAMLEGIEMARTLCEFVEICAPSGVGKTESKTEFIARARKSEGFFAPVWSIELDESCISMKAVLNLIAREIAGVGNFDPKNEFAMSQAIIEAAAGRRGVLLVDEGQHLADALKKMGIPIVNLLRRFVDRGLFGIAYFGNGEIYRRLTTGTGKDKGAYTQLLSRMQDFRVQIRGLGQGRDGITGLTKEDVLAVAAAWGVTGVEEEAYCLKAAAQPGALRTMTNIFRRSLERFDCIDIVTMNKIRSF